MFKADEVEHGVQDLLEEAFRYPDSVHDEAGQNEFGFHWRAEHGRTVWQSLMPNADDDDSVAMYGSRGRQVDRDTPDEWWRSTVSRSYLAGILGMEIVRTQGAQDELAEGWFGAYRRLFPARGILDLWEDIDQEEREENLRRLEMADSEDKVFWVLELEGLFREAGQLRQYLKDRRGSLEEEEYPGIRIESLKAVSRFLILNRGLPFSAIKADYDGYADLEWYLSSKRQEGDEDDLHWVDGGGQIVLRFVTPNLIEFAMLSGPWLDGAERLSLSGTMSHKKMRTIIDMFVGRMVAYGDE